MPENEGRNPWSDFLNRWPGLEFLEETGCPVCGGTRSRDVRRLGPTWLKQCRGCGLHYVSPRLSGAARNALYRLNPSPLPPERHAMLRQLMAGRLGEMRREMFPLPPERAGQTAMLDIGCGFGHFLDQCRPFHGSVEGTELSQIQARYAREILGLRVTEDDVTGREWPREYDFITAWELIEHVPRPAALIEWAFRHLRPGGQLMLSTPNHGSLFRLLLGRRWFYYIPTQHLSHFTARGLSALLRKTGFSRVRTATSGRSLLGELANGHNAPASETDVRLQWAENLFVRERIEVERERHAPPSDLRGRLWNALWWRLIYWPVHSGFGDQLRIYAVKP